MSEPRTSEFSWGYARSTTADAVIPVAMLVSFVSSCGVLARSCPLADAVSPARDRVEPQARMVSCSASL